MARAKPWLKLWTEWVNDPKILRLSLAEAGAWAKMITLARVCNAGGDIISGGTPLSIEEMCDALHITKPDEINQFGSMLSKMEGQGSLAWNENCLRVVNFIQRQDKSPSDSPEAVRERVRQFRLRHNVTKKAVTLGGGGITDNLLSVTIPEGDCVTALHPHSEVEAVTRKGRYSPGVEKMACNGDGSLHIVTSKVLVEITRCHEQYIGAGRINGYTADTLREFSESYTGQVEWIEKAFKAAPPEKRRWSYVAAILERWQKEGGPDEQGKGRKIGTNRPNSRALPKKYTTPEEDRENYRREHPEIEQSASPGS